MTVCCTLSWFVQVTVVPGTMVSGVGLKAKPCIVTDTVSDPVAAMGVIVGEAANAPAPLP